MHSLDTKNLKKEFRYSFSKSSGKGGQHVNKVETRVTVCYDLVNSKIPLAILERIMKRLSNQTNSRGEICVSVEKHRNQSKNKALASEKLAKLILEASKKPQNRIKTGPTLSSKIKRLDSKKKQSEKKANRKFRNF